MSKQMLVARYENSRIIEPLEVSSRDCPIFNKPLHEIQLDELDRLFSDTYSFVEVSNIEDVAEIVRHNTPTLVFPSNLFFSAELVDNFLKSIKKHEDSHSAFQVAIPVSSSMARDFIAPLNDLPTTNCHNQECFLLPLFLFKDRSCSPLPIPIDIEESKYWHLSLPTRTDTYKNQSVFSNYPVPPKLDFAPLRVSLSTCFGMPINHWVHLLTANIVFSLYTDALRFSKGESPVFFQHPTNDENTNSATNARDLIFVGKNCQIDPTATLIGPTILGENVIVGPGAYIVSSVIGQNSVIGENCHIRLSVIGKDTTFPAVTGSSTLWSVVLDGALICSLLRFSVVGQDVFIGAGVWTTDRILKDKEESPDISYGGSCVRVLHDKKVSDSGYWVLGSAIGNRSKLGTGTIILPGRTIWPDSVIYGKVIK
jgi:UDP-N-acetylglucosamine diphosphorylase / glucose-1-phosphate thymidylyltransferase / UDP-N-acetylgalactosamine diphosphorylase / glucosamine-1-phosphate N-acetyltransferase / galactosamine-1-phosphate N-acetyltransferase